MSDRVNALLSDRNGVLVPQLRPLAEALTAAENPYSVLNWLYYNPAARLLADLAAHDTEITHSLLDGLPPTHSTRDVRDVLVTIGVLPRRAEHLCRLEAWTDQALDELPPRHQRILRPFAEWHVIRDARRRTAHNRYTEGAAAGDRTDIRTAIAFLRWLDLWLHTHPTLRRDSMPFLRWRSPAASPPGSTSRPARRARQPTSKPRNNSDSSSDAASTTTHSPGRCASSAR